MSDKNISKRDTKKKPSFWRSNLDYGESKLIDQDTGHEELEKEAVIRGDNIRDCPFKLPIPYACKCVGSAIYRMAPTKDNETIKKANRLVYAYHKECKQCPFADKILDNYEKVDCDFGDTGQGMESTPFRGSPLYPQLFQGMSLTGLYGYPLSFYGDNNTSRNLFFGLFSMLGRCTIEEMIKLAEKYEERGEEEKAYIINNLLDKLSKIREKYQDTFDKLKNYLEKYRIKQQKGRIDTGMLWELAQKSWGPKQISD